jgi:hypothetical protein
MGAHPLTGAGRLVAGRKVGANRWFRGARARLESIVRGRSLDRQLALAVDPRSSEAIAYRAAKLTGSRTRTALAEGIDRILRSAHGPARALSSAIPPHRGEVAIAAPRLRQLRRILSTETSVDAAGMARLQLLLTDPVSVLYRPAQSGALSDEVEAIIASLAPRERT